ncbi:hypothetical protein SLEP1_g19876 [Rubroshorea leprosula]|uniref:CCT domain-containing protein n=1 Tax=Rubroshorea leprosula TaxID=152421 RepID=A0AAV5J698_9ROSI|nr:hypothetical protein SLEP1_g19876 [Rubroshorea leprosula]
MNTFTRASDSLSPYPVTPQTFPLPQLVETEFDFASEAFHGSSSSGYNSPSSLASCCTHKPCFMQRSASSHSLQKNGLHCLFGSSCNEFVGSDVGPVRRVCSTGDLEQGFRMAHHSPKSESLLLNESCAIIESMSKACRYSPEEKKERIERYRSKRNLRNFNKKIKYACRKTLADSRPRIRGRFARNDEIEKISNHQVQWSQYMGGDEEEEEEDDNWVNFLNSLSTNLIP